MGISLPSININPGIGGQGIDPINPIGDAGAQFLQAFLGTQGNVIRREEERGRNSRSSDEMAIRQMEHQLKIKQFDLELADKKAELEREKAKGNALKEMLPALIARGHDPAQFMGGQQGGDLGMGPGDNTPGAQRPQAPSPMGTFTQQVQGLPSEAVPGFVNDFSKIATDAQGKADRLAKIDEVARASSNPQGARSILAYTELGGTQLPKEVTASLFPELFPNGREVDPQAMNAATALFKTGLFTWGQSRRQAGLQKFEGIPDDVKFAPPPTRPRQDQLKAGAQLDVMVAAKPVLDEFSTRKAPGPVTTWLKSAKSGPIKDLLNITQGTGDQKFVQAAKQFTDAWVRVVSGAQTNENEYGRFISAITENFGDAPSTREQKRNMRAIMIQAVSDIAGGAVTPTQAVERAMKLDWTPEQQKFLAEELKKAKQYEADLKAGKVKVDLSSPSPTTPEELAEQVQELINALRNP